MGFRSWGVNMSVASWRARFGLVWLSLLSVPFLASSEVYAQQGIGGGVGGVTPQCVTTAAQQPTLRTEGLTELVGDILLRCTEVGIAGGVTSTSGSGSIASLDVFFPDSFEQRPQSYSGVRGTVGVLTRTYLPIFARHPSSMPDALLLIDEPTPFVSTGILGNFGSAHTSSFVELGVHDATGTTTTKTQFSVPVLLGVNFPAPLLGPGGGFQIFGGGMFDQRRMDFATSEAGAHIATTGSTSKMQLNPAVGAGLSVALLPDIDSLVPRRVIDVRPKVRANVSLQYLADFQSRMNQDVRSFAFDSSFYTQNSGRQVNSTVLATVSFPLDQFLGPPPPLPPPR